MTQPTTGRTLINLLSNLPITLYHVTLTDLEPTVELGLTSSPQLITHHTILSTTHLLSYLTFADSLSALRALSSKLKNRPIRQQNILFSPILALGRRKKNIWVQKALSDIKVFRGRQKMSRAPNGNVSPLPGPSFNPALFYIPVPVQGSAKKVVPVEP